MLMYASISINNRRIKWLRNPRLNSLALTFTATLSTQSNI